MDQILSKAKTAFVNFLDRDLGEDGSATVEAVIWLPFFLAAFTLVVDTTVVLHKQSYIMRVVQDGNRGLSINKFTSENQTEDFIELALDHLSPNVVAQTALVDGIITTTVSIPVGDLEVVGVWEGLTDSTITLRAQHLLEE